MHETSMTRSPEHMLSAGFEMRLSFMHYLQPSMVRRLNYAHLLAESGNLQLEYRNDRLKRILGVGLTWNERLSLVIVWLFYVGGVLYPFARLTRLRLAAWVRSRIVLPAYRPRRTS